MAVLSGGRRRQRRARAHAAVTREATSVGQRGIERGRASGGLARAHKSARREASGRAPCGGGHADCRAADGLCTVERWRERPNRHGMDGQGQGAGPRPRGPGRVARRDRWTDGRGKRVTNTRLTKAKNGRYVHISVLYVSDPGRVCVPCGGPARAAEHPIHITASCSPRRPAQLATAEDMNVQMIHGLRTLLAIVHHQPKAVWAEL